MKPKYAIHPGWIRSKNDGDWHYIGAAALARLYELKPNEYVIWWMEDAPIGDDYIHLYPDYHGRYGRPND